MSKKINYIKEEIQEELKDDVLLRMGHKKYKASCAYARALFRFGNQFGVIKNLKKDFDDFFYLWRNTPILKQFIQCHALDRNTRKGYLKTLLGECMHRGFIFFLDKLIDNSHTDLLPGIYKAFSELVDGIGDKRKVRIVSAFPVNNKQLQLLQKSLEISLKKQISIKNDVDQGILGGFVCYTDSVKIDMSLKRDLEKLKSNILSISCEGEKENEG